MHYGMFESISTYMIDDFDDSSQVFQQGKRKKIDKNEFDIYFSFGHLMTISIRPDSIISPLFFFSLFLSFKSNKSTVCCTCNYWQNTTFDCIYIQTTTTTMMCEHQLYFSSWTLEREWRRKIYRWTAPTNHGQMVTSLFVRSTTPVHFSCFSSFSHSLSHYQN